MSFINRYFFFGVVWFVIAAFSYANDDEVVSARTTGSSGHSVIQTDVWACSNNQAGLAFIHETAVATGFMNHYLIPELSTRSIISVLPVGEGTAGLMFKYTGGELLNESRFSLAYGRKLFQWLGTGILLNYHYRHIEAINQKKSAITGEIGIIAQPLEYLRAGLHIKNPVRSGYQTNKNDELFSGLALGVSYIEDDVFSVFAESCWEYFDHFTFSAGTEMIFRKRLFIRTGISLSGSPAYSFGLGSTCKNMAVDIGFNHHQILGYSTAVSFIWYLNNPKKKRKQVDPGNLVQ